MFRHNPWGSGMKKSALLVIGLGLALVLPAVRIEAGQFDNIISAADVEKATGLSGVKQVPRQKAVDGITQNKFLTGDLNFIRSDRQPIIEVQFRPAFAFDQFKGDSGFIKAPVPGLGDEAYTGPSFDPQTTVNFRKGAYFVAVSTHIDPKDKSKAVLKIDQVIAVSRIIASRMK
jgi:hypothetical protein